MHQKCVIVFVPVVVKSPTARAPTVLPMWTSTQSDPPNLNLQKILAAAQAHIQKRNNPAPVTPEMLDMLNDLRPENRIKYLDWSKIKRIRRMENIAVCVYS